MREEVAWDEPKAANLPCEYCRDGIRICGDRWYESGSDGRVMVCLYTCQDCGRETELEDLA